MTQPPKESEDGGRFSNLPERLRQTTEAMACQCLVDFGLWNAHCNAVLDAALKIEALERELAARSTVKEGEDG